jgi:hypothetical protein
MSPDFTPVGKLSGAALFGSAAVLLLAAALSCSTAAAAADGADAPQVQREIIPGSELMTSRERERYRIRMRAAGTPEKQAQAREGHVKQMRERARLRGLELAPLKQSAP